MGKLWVNDGKLVLDSQGRLVVCDDCPCAETGTGAVGDTCVDCPEQFVVNLSGAYSPSCPTDPGFLCFDFQFNWTAATLTRSVTDECLWEKRLTRFISSPCDNYMWATLEWDGSTWEFVLECRRADNGAFVQTSVIYQASLTSCPTTSLIVTRVAGGTGRICCFSAVCCWPTTFTLNVVP